jgi:hypothetical protein
MVVAVTKEIPKTYAWCESGFYSGSVPEALSNEGARVYQLLQEYFSSVTTYDLAIDEIRAQIELLAPGTSFLNQISDLVRLSETIQKVRGTKKSGAISGVLLLLQDIDIALSEIEYAALAFNHVPPKQMETPNILDESWIDLSYARFDRTLSKVTMVSVTDWNDGSGQRFKKRLFWRDLLPRFVERSVVQSVFDNFDENVDGFIPVQGDEKQLKEATDLAFSLITLASATPTYVRPSSLVGAIGLFGDKWLVPSNGDGKVDREEFYALVKAFQDIAWLANVSSGDREMTIHELAHTVLSLLFGCDSYWEKAS